MTLGLTAISPLDGRYADKLNCLRPIFSEYGLIKFRVLVEVRWLQHLANKTKLSELKPFSSQANQLLNKLVDHFSEKEAARVKEIEKEINHDVKAVEYFIREYLAKNKELKHASEFIHFACTSEDINNLAYALMLKTARDDCFLPELTGLTKELKTLAHQYANQAMLARTHGQPATPTTVGKELANVIARLQRQIEQLKSTSFLGKINGATGNYNPHVVVYPTIDWQKLNREFVSALGLEWNAYTTQIEPHDFLAEFFAVMMRINTILIDFSRDMWGYIAIQYFKQKPLKKEVGSSTMPHKVNPIDFENAEGNFGIANALLDFMALKLPISRWQRDLSDSTVLRNIGVALGHSFLAYQSLRKGLSKVVPDSEVLNADLDQHWEVLAEPIQMMLRRFGVENAYEKLKTFSRGETLTQKNLHAFIAKLDLPEKIKQELYQLTPQNYLGYATTLAKKI